MTRVSLPDGVGSLLWFDRWAAGRDRAGGYRTVADTDSNFLSAFQLTEPQICWVSVVSV